MKRLDLRLVSLALVLAVVAVPALAGAAAPVVDVSLGPDSIDFQPRVEYDSMVVILSGGGQDLRVELGSDDYPGLSLVDDAGKALPDGVYTWEVRLAPTAGQLRAQLRTNNELGGAAPAVGERGNERVQSGSFTIRDGAAVDPYVTEAGPALDNVSAPAALTPMSAAQVISGDLTVYNSLCVGTDCLSAESYGFDTIRLKENNTRFHFDDTSTSASFPRNDWRFIANDSANGGASYLAIEDSTAGNIPFRVLAGAGANALYVDAQGDVGLNTSNPVVELHVADGDTPTLRLEQNNSSGFTPQTWDVAGNETNFFVRDVNGGSKLPFRILPGADDGIVLAADGKVGFGTASPNERLHIRTSGDVAFRLEDTSSGGASWLFKNNTANGAFIATDNPSGGSAPLKVFSGIAANTLVVGSAGGNAGVAVNKNGTGFPLEVGTDGTNGNGAHVTVGGVWTDGSSRSSKENIHELALDDALQTVLALRPQRYNYIGDKTEEYVGFIAEDVPELVATNSRRHLAPMDIVAVLTRVVQAQQTQNGELAAKVAQLEAMVQTLLAEETEQAPQQ